MTCPAAHRARHDARPVATIRGSPQGRPTGRPFLEAAVNFCTTCEAAHTLRSTSALELRENCALEPVVRVSCATGLLQARDPEGTDGTMTWLEILLVAALLLIALGLAR